MHATRRMTAATAALVVVLAGCAQPPGGPAVSDLDTGTPGAAPDRANDDPDDSRDADADGAGDESPDAGRVDPTDHADGDHADGDQRDDRRRTAQEPSPDRPPTAGEIAAAFDRHAGAHAAHAPAEATREFPEGIVPDRVRIPAIGVDAEITGLSLAGSEPEVPEDFAQVGWYDQTREPGEIGPAVLAGHIDSRAGPAVFVDLDELEPGDEIVVADLAGDERRFIVDALGQYPKDDLPDEVFGFGEPTPELRLITCGGTFDRSIGHYRDNVVVYASLSGA